MKILIAEDDIVSRSILEIAMPQWGYEVVSASDGEKAWKILQAPDRPQLALLDWMMPNLDGLTLCRRLRRQKLEDPLYLMMVTSKNTADDIVLGLEAGADDYVTKPFNMAELRARVDVGRRTVKLQRKVQRYARDMEKLAKDRAVQLAHKDRMATLGILSAGVAHEINNPASFIAISTQTLERNWPLIQNCIEGRASVQDRQRSKLLAGEIPGILADMKSGVDRIRDIVSGLRSYSRSDSAKRSGVDITGCIDNALKLCVFRLKHMVTVDKKLPSDLPHLKANPRELEQVFINLFINSADAMDGGGGTLTISAGRKGENIEVKVRDTGPGISVDKLGMIFAPFFTSKELGKGTGLGLSISRNIVEDHGGSLTVQNHPDGGAEFCVSLPISGGPIKRNQD